MQKPNIQYGQLRSMEVTALQSQHGIILTVAPNVTQPCESSQNVIFKKFKWNHFKVH